MLKLIKEETIKPVPVEDIENIDTNTAPVLANDVEKTLMNNACQDLINGLIQEAWNFISQVNSTIATIECDFQDKEAKAQICELLNSVVDDSTINIGILHKAFEVLSNEKAELLNSGAEKAKEILDNSEK